MASRRRTASADAVIPLWWLVYKEVQVAVLPSPAVCSAGGASGSSPRIPGGDLALVGRRVVGVGAASAGVVAPREGEEFEFGQATVDLDDFEHARVIAAGLCLDAILGLFPSRPSGSQVQVRDRAVAFVFAPGGLRGRWRRRGSVALDAPTCLDPTERESCSAM